MKKVYKKHYTDANMSQKKCLMAHNVFYNKFCISKLCVSLSIWIKLTLQWFFWSSWQSIVWDLQSFDSQRSRLRVWYVKMMSIQNGYGFRMQRKMLGNIWNIWEVSEMYYVFKCVRLLLRIPIKIRHSSSIISLTTNSQFFAKSSSLLVRFIAKK